MISNYFFLLATFLISLNGIRIFKLGISDTVYLVATVLAIFETLIYDRRNRFCWLKNQLLFPAWIIATGALLSLFRSNYFGIATLEIIQSIYVITFFISLSWIMVRRGLLGKTINVFIGSALIAVSIAIFDYLTKSNIGPMIAGMPDEVQVVRFAGPFEHPNTLGGFLMVASALVLVKWLKGRGKIEFVFNSILMVLFLFGIYLSGSNAALVGECMVFGVIFLFSSKNSRQKLIAYIVPILGTVLLFFLLSGSYIDFFDTITRNVNRAVNTTISLRVEIYGYAFDSIRENLIFGVGYDQLPTSGIPDNARLLPGQVHNVLISILYVGGIISLVGWGIAYVYIFTIAGKVCFSQKKHLFSLHFGLGLAAGVIAIILIMQAQASLYRRDWWLVIGLLLAVFWETKKEKRLCIS